MSILRPSGTSLPADLTARSRLRVGRRVALLTIFIILAAALYTAASASSTRARRAGGGVRAEATASAPARAAATTPAPARRAVYTPALLRQFAVDTPLPPVESVQTFAADCSTPKDAFLLGEDVCVKVAGGPLLTVFGRRLSLTGPEGVLRNPSNTDASATDPTTGAVGTLALTTQSQSFTIHLPSTASTTIDGLLVENRGEWRVNSLFASRYLIRNTASFTVSQVNNASSDLAVYNNPSVDRGSVAAGSTVDYVLLVVNRGPDAAANVTVSDSIPANATLTSATQIGAVTDPAFTCPNVSNGNCTDGSWTIASMPRRSSATFRLSYQISGGASAGSTISNTANVSSSTSDPAAGNNTDTADVEIVSGAAAGTCVLNCPGNITRTADATNGNGDPGAVVTFGSATATGSCGSITASPQSGTFFPVGDTTVTVSSSTGASCSFVVTVVGSNPPTISCPAPVATPAPAGECAADLTAAQLGTPTTTGTGVTVEGNRNDGLPLDAPYPAGTTTITYTATDTAGRTATCTQTVTVNANDTTPPTITAPLAVTIGTGPNPDSSGGSDDDGNGTPGTVAACSAVVADDQLGTADADDNCTANVTITRSGIPAGHVFPIGTTTITYTATDAAGNHTEATQTVTVVDDTPPLITAPADAAYTCLGDVPTASPSQATATDNCGTPSINVQESSTGVGSLASPRVITRIFTATDTATAHNTASAVQTITVIDNTPPTITAPADKVLYTGVGATSCGVTVSDLDGTLGTATASDNCAGVTVTRGGSNVFPVGDTFVTYTATDAAGNTASATQKVTVIDNTPPVVTAPANITVGNDLNSCSATLNPGAATATDNCAGVSSPTGTRSDTQALSAAYPKGTTTITWTATDGHGNSASATQTVTVNDTQGPTVNVPADIVVLLPVNTSATSMAVSYTVTATDNCPGTVALNVSPASGSVFSVGTTTVTATATDAAGNTTTSTFNVTVLYVFSGFFSPVGNLPTLNVVNAGRAIPVKFSLSGDKGLNIFATGYPASGVISCNSNDPAVDVDETVTAGSSSLSYGGGQYNYVWKTESSWVGTCRQLVVKLNDGSEHRANFKFK